MTPKEKAQELFCKMYGCKINTDLNDIYLINGDGYFLAKDCAIIAVDEILNHHSQEQGLYRIDTYYWKQVKQEIEKL